MFVLCPCLMLFCVAVLLLVDCGVAIAVCFGACVFVVCALLSCVLCLFIVVLFLKGCLLLCLFVL